MRILVTRPEHDAQRTAATLRALGHDVIVAPLLRIDAISDASFGRDLYDAVVITSANAARAMAVHGRYYEFRGVPVFAVGGRSADVMRIAGFGDITSADGNFDDLVRLIAKRVKPGARLLYLAGEDRSGDLAGALPGFAVFTAIIYRAVAAATLPRTAANALAGGVDAVLHFSRRSAETYVATSRGAGLLEAALKKPAHFCLSAQIAEPLAQAGAADIRVAARPDETALIELLEVA